MSKSDPWPRTTAACHSLTHVCIQESVTWGDSGLPWGISQQGLISSPVYYCSPFRILSYRAVPMAALAPVWVCEFRALCMGKGPPWGTGDARWRWRTQCYSVGKKMGFPLRRHRDDFCFHYIQMLSSIHAEECQSWLMLMLKIQNETTGSTTWDRKIEGQVRAEQHLSNLPLESICVSVLNVFWEPLLSFLE